MIARPRLRQVVGDRPVVIAIAAGGYGKSVLIRELATGLPVPSVLCELDRPTGVAQLLATLVRSARRDGLSDFANALAAAGDDPTEVAVALARALSLGDPISLVIDEVGRLDDDAAAVLADCIEAVRPPGRLLLAGRSLPGALVGLASASYLGADELAFDLAETAQLVARPADSVEVGTVHQLTGGWPAAVAVAATRTRPHADRFATAPPPSPAVPAFPASAAQTAVSVLPSADDVPAAVRALACLPLINTAVARTVTGRDDLTALTAAGVPFAARQDGWVELSDPLRDRLADPDALSRDQRRAVADIYARTGQLSAALALLAGTRGSGLPPDPVGAVLLLESVHWSALEQIGLPDVRAVVDVVDDGLLVAHPGVLVSVVRMTENLPVGDERGRWIARGLRILPVDAPAHGLLLAESGRMAIRRGDLEAAAGLAEQALALLPDTGGDPLTRGRAEFVRGSAAIYRGDPEGLRVGMAHLLEAVAALHQAGDRRWEAEAQIMVGFGLDYPSGAVDRAADRLRTAIGLLAAADPVRASYLTYLAEILLWVPDLEAADAALREAQTIAARTYDQRLTAYVHWSQAWLCCTRGDITATAEHLTGVLRNAGAWFGLPSGLSFYGEAVEMYASLGDRRRAEEALTAALARPDAADHSHLLARATAQVAARFHDPLDARRQLLAQADSAETRPIDRPRLMMLAAWCSHRAGQEEAGRVEAAAAVQAASAIGLASAQWIRERDIAAWAAEATGSTAPRATAEIAVLGTFAVTRSGDPVTPPPGLPSDLVALLAVRGPQPVESVIDILWPDIELTTGRSRLRNLLNRIRSSSGDLIDRRGVELRLAVDCTCDLWAFRDAAAGALADTGEQRTGLARQALMRAGRLLPALDAEWLVGPRREVHRTTLELLDLVAESSWSVGDLDDARRQLRQAIELEPYDEIRYVRLARLLIRQGRRGSAREVVRRALTATAELGTTPSDTLAALVRTLGRRREPADATSAG